MIKKREIEALPHDFTALVHSPHRATLDHYDIIDHLNTPGIVVTLNRTALNVRTALRKKGYKTDNLFFVDGIAKKIGAQLELQESKQIYPPLDLDHFSNTLHSVAQTTQQPKFLILDAVQDLLNYHDEHTVENFLKHLSETLKLSRTNLILVLDNRTLKKGVRKRLYKLCDKVFS